MWTPTKQHFITNPIVKGDLLKKSWYFSVFPDNKSSRQYCYISTITFFVGNFQEHRKYLWEKIVEDDGSVSRTKISFLWNFTLFFCVPAAISRKKNLQKTRFFEIKKHQYKFILFQHRTTNPETDTIQNSGKEPWDRLITQKTRKTINMPPVFFCIFLTYFWFLFAGDYWSFRFFAQRYRNNVDKKKRQI